MRASMKFMIVTGEVLLFGLLAAATLAAAEFPSLKPTYVAANVATSTSPFSEARPTRITLTNKLGQQSTLEYRKPVRIVDEDEMLPINDLPVLSSPARDEDLSHLNDIRPISYERPLSYSATTVQQNYPPQQHYQANSSLPLVQTANCAQPPVTYAPATVHYPPATQYTMPNYAQPVTGVPQTVYRPVVPLAPVAVQSNLQVTTGIYGQPVIYRPGQPLRNVWRWLTP